MLRDRLIFALIHSNGVFTQSRNFRLQRVGNIHWLENNYRFRKISFSLDELILVDASKDGKDIAGFAKLVSKVVDDVFIPVAAGGGIRRPEDAALLFQNGADKVVLNTPLHEDPALVRALVARYGSQSVVASVDYRLEHGKPVVYVADGTRALDVSLKDHLASLDALQVGEILLNSIDKDGTGFGYDLETIARYAPLVRVPLIIMGGAGNGIHLKQGLELPGVSAVATANLFNFIGDGLPNARKHLLDGGLNLARWIDAAV